MSPSSPLITLTTDFGQSDNYAGILHGVIHTINRDTTIVDLCHDIPGQNVSTGSFILGTAWRYFPPGSIHVAIVDPQVGNVRRAIALSAGSHFFVAPDNGILTMAIRELRPTLSPEAGSVATNELHPDIQAVVLDDPRFHLKNVSTTFHGRDIFAPAAAYLSKGVPLVELGSTADSVFLLAQTIARRRPDGSFIAHIIHVDRFGNLITDLRADRLNSAVRGVKLRIRDHVIPGLYRTYSEGPEVLALVGSTGRIEIAQRDGSAANTLFVSVGEEVEVLVDPP